MLSIRLVLHGCQTSPYVTLSELYNGPEAMKHQHLYVTDQKTRLRKVRFKVTWPSQRAAYLSDRETGCRQPDATFNALPARPYEACSLIIPTLQTRNGRWRK